MTDTSHDRLLIIDFGSQVTQLIARRLRELNVYCEIHPYQNVSEAFLADFAPKAVIFSGGPASVVHENSPRPPASVFDLGVPILGICYGQQVMMQMLGGRVGPSHAFVHLVDFGGEVTVHGMAAKDGDIIHADRHGAVIVPKDAVLALPEAVALCMRREEPVLAAARGDGFTIARLKEAMGTAKDIH